MDKLEQLKPYITEMDSLFQELFEEFEISDLLKRNELPKYRGIYAFYENGKPIYVGRANNIRKRIQWHTRESSGSESASFAFNLAKMEYAKKSEITLQRKQLMQIEEFIEIFRKHKLNLTNIEFRCIAVENDILQTMFEPYLAFKLGTYPINNTFENH
ncbi:GIY-YIG catalytic domain-containing protein [Flavobacterium sp. 1]|uniref:GIY-YIG nuclease family protein n=1 Tax=Flavobacterium sp. 1 TaxID=2035200 RepID=UPI000C234436|nr:GIY-YIG nuclease family protein [Flavobacterium sp. 1]PJJ09813.1 GIY-YIG catalytic domain-containing protein [Flavobacterium sp. 1]